MRPSWFFFLFLKFIHKSLGHFLFCFVVLFVFVYCYGKNEDSLLLLFFLCRSFFFLLCFLFVTSLIDPRAPNKRVSNVPKKVLEKKKREKSKKRREGKRKKKRREAEEGGELKKKKAYQSNSLFLSQQALKIGILKRVPLLSPLFIRECVRKSNDTTTPHKTPTPTPIPTPFLYLPNI